MDLSLIARFLSESPTLVKEPCDSPLHTVLAIVSNRYSKDKRQVIHTLLTLPPLNRNYFLFRSTCMSHPRRQRSV